MNIQALAQRRAEAAARVEALSQLGHSTDRGELFALTKARSQAKRAYQEAEAAYQSAVATMSVDEMRAMGLVA